MIDLRKIELTPILQRKKIKGEKLKIKNKNLNQLLVVSCKLLVVSYLIATLVSLILQVASEFLL